VRAIHTQPCRSTADSSFWPPVVHSSSITYIRKPSGAVRYSVGQRRKAMRIVYYTSRHGYGHATRTIPVIERLRETLGPDEVQIRTNAPMWLFPPNFNEGG